MNHTSVICEALIRGEVLSIMDGFKKYKITNIPREMGRLIKRRFKVEIDARQIDFKYEDGRPGHYFTYRLWDTPGNRAGIKAMKKYVVEQKELQSARNEAKKKYKQLKLL